MVAHTPLGGGSLNKTDFGITDVLLENSVVQKVAATHNVSAGQILLRWLLQRGVVVIPKSMKPERMATNLKLFHFELSAEEMSLLYALDK